MEQHTTTRPIRQYTQVLATTSSFGLESTFGRPRAAVYKTSHGNREAHALVPVTNVEESVRSARVRIRVDLERIIDSWTGLRPLTRRRLWAKWTKQYPSLSGVDPITVWECRRQQAAMVDLLRLMGTEPDAFAAWVTKSRALIINQSRHGTPADMADLAAVALGVDYDRLSTRARPFLTIYNHARRRTRRVLKPRTLNQQPLVTPRFFASNHSDPTQRSKKRTITYSPVVDTTPTDSIDTMVAVDDICRRNSEDRWNQLLDETLHNIPTLTGRTRRRTRANYRNLIRAAA